MSSLFTDSQSQPGVYIETLKHTTMVLYKCIIDLSCIETFPILAYPPAVEFWYL
jgi:hypothetical protein